MAHQPPCRGRWRSLAVAIWAAGRAHGHTGATQSSLIAGLFHYTWHAHKSAGRGGASSRRATPRAGLAPLAPRHTWRGGGAGVGRSPQLPGSGLPPGRTPDVKCNPPQIALFVFPSDSTCYTLTIHLCNVTASAPRGLNTLRKPQAGAVGGCGPDQGDGSGRRVAAVSSTGSAPTRCSPSLRAPEA